MKCNHLFEALVLGISGACGTAFGSILFTEDFERPRVIGYQQWSLPDGWIRGDIGRKAFLQGIHNKRSGEFSAPEGNNQGYNFQYYTAGLTTEAGALGPPLAMGRGYRFSFDVIPHSLPDGPVGTQYRAQVIAFAEGASRKDARSTGTGNVLLKSFSGETSPDGTIERVSFDYFPHFATQFHAIGKDVGFRFLGSGNAAIVDNLVVEAIAGNVDDFTLVNTDSVDDGIDVIPSRTLRAYFSKNISLAAGAVTIRNLNTGAQLVMPQGDSRLSISGPCLEIDASSFLQFGNSYAVQISDGLIRSIDGNQFAGISDHAAWNFSTAPADPLLFTLSQLEKHCLGELTLNAEQLDSSKKLLDLQKRRYTESAETITAALNLVSTYEKEIGPLWVARGGFDRNKVTNDLAWNIFHVMQTIMDRIYTLDVVAQHADLLEGYKFGSSTNFPGAVEPPTDPDQSYTTTIEGSFVADEYGTDTLHWDKPARKATGAYLAPGSIATIIVPPALVDQGYAVRVGVHTADMTRRPKVLRLDRVSRVYPILTQTLKVGNPLGGGIYIDVPFGADAGNVKITIKNAVRSPLFSAQTFKQTTLQQWRDFERKHPAPWTDIQSEYFKATIPSVWIRNFDDPRTGVEEWDAAMKVVNHLLGIPNPRGKESIYMIVDLLLAYSGGSTGYPMTNANYDPSNNEKEDGKKRHYLTTGIRRGASLELHEQGHAYNMAFFNNDNESVIHLLYTAVLNQLYGESLDDATQIATFNSVRSPFKTIDNTAVTWMVSFNFSPRELGMARSENQYQLKGHAKFLDVVRLFGWEALSEYFRLARVDDEYGSQISKNDNGKAFFLSKAIGFDARPLLHFWGVNFESPDSLATDIEEAGLKPSSEIYHHLLHYKSLVPADLPAYQTFIRGWWGQIPTYSGAYHTQKEHARQYGGPNIGIDPDAKIERPGGDVYNQNSSKDIRDRVQELIDIYFPDGDPGAVSGGVSYATWLTQFPEVTEAKGRTQDPDGDGMANILENLLGTNPSKRDEPLTLSYKSSRGVEIEHSLNANKSSDVDLEYHWSPDLENWYYVNGSDGPGGGLTVSRVIREANGSRTVTLVPSKPLGNFYFRMSAESVQN